MLTACLKSLPALKDGTLVAGINICFFVIGLNDFREARCLTSNLPNPRKLTLSPLTNLCVTRVVIAFRQFLQSLFVNLTLLDNSLIKSVLFILHLFDFYKIVTTRANTYTSFPSFSAFFSFPVTFLIIGKHFLSAGVKHRRTNTRVIYNNPVTPAQSTNVNQFNEPPNI